jgi:hypothetical protein
MPRLLATLLTAHLISRAGGRRRSCRSLSGLAVSVYLAKLADSRIPSQ